MNEYEKSAGCHYCRFNTISFCISERVKLKQNLSVVRLEMTDPFRSRVTPYHNIAYRVVGDTERAVSSTDAASPPATAMNPSSNKDRLTLTRWFEFQFIETTTATTTTIANGGNRNPNSRFIQADWSESSKLSLLLELFQTVQRPSNLISMTRIQRLNHGLIQLDLRWNPRRNCGCLEINAIESPSTASVAKTQSQIIMTNSLYGFMDCSKSNPRRRNGLFQLRSHGSILNHWNKQTNKKKRTRRKQNKNDTLGLNCHRIAAKSFATNRSSAPRNRYKVKHSKAGRLDGRYRTSRRESFKYLHQNERREHKQTTIIGFFFLLPKRFEIHCRHMKWW